MRKEQENSNNNFNKNNNNNNPNNFNLNTNDIIKVWAKPNSSKSLLINDLENSRIIAYLNSIPDDNKANLELIKLFKKQLKLKIEIIKGHKSRNKLIKIY